MSKQNRQSLGLWSRRSTLLSARALRLAVLRQDRRACPGPYVASRSISSSRSRKTAGPWSILSRAAASVNHSARSASGMVILRPLFGGHSISHVSLVIAAASRSPSKAKAVTLLPPGWIASPSGTSLPCGKKPVSSLNSLLAAASAASPSSGSPFGIDQHPRSLLRQNGPPGWTSRTCSFPPEKRYMRIPALRFIVAPAREGPGSGRASSIRQPPPDNGQRREKGIRGTQTVGNFAVDIGRRLDGHRGLNHGDGMALCARPPLPRGPADRASGRGARGH